MKKYIHVYYLTFVQNIKVLLSYRFDLLFGVIGLIIKNIANLLIIYMLYIIIDDIAGYTFYHILLLQGIASLSFGIWHTFFINTISIPYYIKTGTFSTFLTRPMHPIFFIMTDQFDEDGLGDIVYGIIIATIAVINLNIHGAYILLLILLSLFTSLIFASISLLGSIISFFTNGYMDLSTIVMDMSFITKYPTSIFKKSLSFIFTFIIPISLIAFIPSEMLINSLNVVKYSLIIIIVSITFFIITVKVWSMASVKYDATGS